MLHPLQKIHLSILFPNREKTANFPDLPPNSTQEPEETMLFECPFQGSSSAGGSLDTSRPLRRHPCPRRESSSGHGSPCPRLQDTGRATGLSCGQGTSHTHKWLCLVLASSPHPHSMRPYRKQKPRLDGDMSKQDINMLREDSQLWGLVVTAVSLP